MSKHGDSHKAVAPIRQGDIFKSRSGQQWLVTEAMGFGRGYWVVSVPERTRQTIFKRNQLENMERV
jgi:hypothetical protein